MTTLTKIMRKPITSAIVAILFGFFVATIVLASAGYDPIEAFGALIDGMIGKPKYIANVIIKATPLLFTGVAVAFAFRVGLFNIGAEGQYVFGTVFATIVGVLLDLPPVLQIPVVLLVGMLAGAAAGALVGWLKAKFGIHEVITSIMLNWISLYFNNFVVNSEAFHKANSTKSLPINPSGYTMLFTDMKSSSDGLAALKDIPVVGDAIARTDANVGIIVAIIAAIFIGWLLMRTKVGYEMRAVGFNRDAAQFTGINVKRNLVLCMAISGALCGVAGALNITGLNPHSISVLAAFENYGFNGLSVAFIAGCSPVGCIPASLLFAGLLYGGQSVQQVVGAPSEIISIIIGTIVFFMALGGVIPMLAEYLDRRRAKQAKLAEGTVGVNAATNDSAQGKEAK
ncbi:ABC transporter permease [Lancefieldella rimae]|uniref:Branched-chain amino acid ABC transporter, permease protein n=2 Tax=Lancefieldella rimae TaxID=1383 RepID=B9CM27_LANR4|nr:ABC transporter permease [Lancefieldella rimae]EEE17302.1 branched-chain amino acid ABC transporter, permease protein [Lancefieldella rimae ATCC 49626]MBF4804842.1 ABC transporter permease [Lancefieldella rimae]